MHATPSATPHVAPSRRVWEDDNIRRNIFTHLAVYGWRTMAVEWLTLACTDKRGFEAASSLIWVSGGAHQHWIDRLQAADQARRPTYLRAIRTVGISALSPDSLSEVIQLYPGLHTVVARNGDIEYTLRLVRDATGKIRSSTCSILCIPVSLELAQMGDAIAHLRANVPEDWNTTVYFDDFDIFRMSDFEALDRLVASYDFALTEPTLMLRDEDAGKYVDCLDMMASRRHIDKIHLMGISLQGVSGEHGLSLPDAITALDRIGVVQDAGIVVGRVCVDAGSAAQVFDLLLSCPEILRECESLRISFPLPSLTDIASLQQIKLATWTDPRITRQRLVHVHFDVPDRYPASGDVWSRRMRLEESTAFLDCLAQLCLCVGGATATYSLQLWDTPDGNAYIPEGHTKITQDFSKRFNQYLKGEINRMIIKQREAAASSWRRIGKCNFHRGRHAEAKSTG